MADTISMAAFSTIREKGTSIRAKFWNRFGPQSSSFDGETAGGSLKLKRHATEQQHNTTGVEQAPTADSKRQAFRNQSNKTNKSNDLRPANLPSKFFGMRRQINAIAPEVFGNTGDFSGVDGFGLVKEQHISFTRKLAFNDDYKQTDLKLESGMIVPASATSFGTNFLAKIATLAVFIVTGALLVFFWYKNRELEQAIADRWRQLDAEAAAAANNVTNSE